MAGTDRRKRWWVGGGLAALAATGGLVALRRDGQPGPAVPRRTGVSAGMEYVVLGHGPRTMLSIPGGPGADVPTGWWARLAAKESRPYLDAGYAVWTVTRVRHMPRGHGVADMADDYARFIRAEFDGPVDVVLGQSYGGMIALYLAGRHPELVGAVVLAAAAATIDGWGQDVEVRWTRLRADGRSAEAGAVMLEYFLRGPRYAALRRLLGPLAAAPFRRSSTPSGDLLVELEAELAYDARDVLGRITAPVLLVCGEADEFFSVDAVRETAAGCGDSTVITYPGKGHVGTLSGRQLPRDVLAWLGRQGGPPGRM